MITGSALLALLVQLIVAGLIFWLVMWFIGYVGIPEPFSKVILVIVGMVVLIFLINVLLTIAGTPLIRW